MILKPFSPHIITVDMVVFVSPMYYFGKTLSDYPRWEDTETVITPGAWPSGSIRNIGYGEKTYQSGKSL